MAIALEETLRRAYAGRRVLVTGHTGFKGSWLTAWLDSLGAQVTGYALPPEDEGLFRRAGIAACCRHLEGDLGDLESLEPLVRDFRPNFIFHLAAQSLVRRGYRQPRETYETNLMGSINILDAIRTAGATCAVVIVTSDKCYEIDGRTSAYTEEDRLGGHDPYSSSKAATELATAAYRSSFFRPDEIGRHGVAVATARSGNVIGGGDWAEDRIVPDAIRALRQNRPIPVRNPEFVRPWQHVLEPLEGYLRLGAQLFNGRTDERSTFCRPWNFGPASASSRTVRELTEEIIRHWGSGTWIGAPGSPGQHEAAHLTLSTERAALGLQWRPRWGFEESVKRTVAWYRNDAPGASTRDVLQRCREQIADFQATP